MRLDALAIVKDGTLINYEMQNGRMHGMEQRMRMYESSINLSFLAKGNDYDNLPDIITIVFHDYDVYGRGKALYTSNWREEGGEVTVESEVLRSEMKYFKTTKECAMGYGGDIDGYINEGKERGRIETIRMFLENRLATPEQIAEVFNITSSELDDIIESFSL